MSYHELPSTDDSGTEARFRRDEVHGLIEFGVPTDHLMNTREGTVEPVTGSEPEASAQAEPDNAA